MLAPAVAAGTAAATVPKSVFSDAVSVSGDEVEYSTPKDRLHPSSPAGTQGLGLLRNSKGMTVDPLSGKVTSACWAMAAHAGPP